MTRARYRSLIKEAGGTDALRKMPKLERYKKLAEISEKLGMPGQREKFARKAFDASVEKNDFMSAVDIVERFSLPEQLLEQNHSTVWWTKSFGRGLRKTYGSAMPLKEGLRHIMIIGDPSLDSEPPFMPQDERFNRIAKLR